MDAARVAKPKRAGAVGTKASLPPRRAQVTSASIERIVVLSGIEKDAGSVRVRVCCACVFFEPRARGVCSASEPKNPKEGDTPHTVSFKYMYV